MPAYRWGDRLLSILAPRTSIRPASATIGPGLPLALGAAAGSGHPAVLIAGDGGFMLHVAELVTAIQHDLPVVICLFNDRGYGVLRGIQARQFDGRTTGVDLVTPTSRPWPRRWVSPPPGSATRPDSSPRSAQPSSRAAPPCWTSTCWP